MKITGLSASNYALWDWCTWKYFLTLRLGFEDVSGPSAILGHLGHKVLEVLSHASMVNHEKNSKIFNPQYLWEICFNHYYNLSPTIAPDIKDPKLLTVAKGIKELIDSPYTPIRNNTVDIEKWFSIPFIGKEYIVDKNADGTPRYFSIRGFIDRVDKINDDTVEIIDYKTGSRACWESKDRHKKGPDDLMEDIQPRLYHLAAKSIYPWAKNVIVTFIYIVDGGPVSVVFCDDDAKQTEDLIRKRFKSIQANNDPQRNITWKCKSMCPFFKDGTCEIVWQEKEELGLKFVEQKYTLLNIKKKMRR
jgi:hypothetical protein